MRPFCRLCAATLVSTICAVSLCDARESVWTVKITEADRQNFVLLPNYMFDGSYVSIHGDCKSNQNKNTKILFQWILLEIDCMEEMYKTDAPLTESLFSLLLQNLTGKAEVVEMWSMDTASLSSPLLRDGSMHFQLSQMQEVDCSSDSRRLLQLTDDSNASYYSVTQSSMILTDKRQKTTFNIAPVKRKLSVDNSEVVSSTNGTVKADSLSLKVTVEMRSSYGFLSAIDWPLLPVNGVMSLLYLTAGTAWIIVWATAQKHSHQIHIVIGCVAVAGALGTTLTFIDLSVRNSDGVGVSTLTWIGKFVSICQLSLTQLLLMVVSTGFGINRPSISNRYVIMLVIIALLSFVSNCFLAVVTSETLKIKYEEPWLLTLSLIIFLVMLLIVNGWISVFSVNTFVYLFQRRHSSRSKLAVFCVFMTCCVTVFILSLCIAIFVLRSGLFHACLQNWKQEWIYSTVAQVQMFVLLVILMWLWRPIDDNNSYAFHPLSVTEVDVASDNELSEKILMDSL